MLEFYFSYRGVLKRLRSGALGAEMDRIASYFSSLGYKRASAKIYLSRIARFGRFAAEHCRSGLINEGIVDGYLGTFTTAPARIGGVSALQHARRVAPERFIVATPCVVDDPDAPLLTSFSDYLSRVRGLEPKSREGVLLGARRFLVWARHHHPGQDLKGLTAEQVLAAVEHQLSLSATSATRTAAVSHVRSFLRFLHWAGHHDQSGAVADGPAERTRPEPSSTGASLRRKPQRAPDALRRDTHRAACGGPGRVHHAELGGQGYIPARLPAFARNEAPPLGRGSPDDPGLAWPRPSRHDPPLRGRGRRDDAART